MARFSVTGDSAEWVRALRKKDEPVIEAAVAALQETAENAVTEGRQDIASAGNFGPEWQSGLKFVTKGERLESRAIIFHRIGFAGVFEHGATIKGKPLLWIPTTPGAPRAGKSGKKLVSATVRGRPMLFDADDRDRHRKPLYIGVPQVTLKKRFHIFEIVKRHVEQMGRLFIEHFKE